MYPQSPPPPLPLLWLYSCSIFLQARSISLCLGKMCTLRTVTSQGRLACRLNPLQPSPAPHSQARLGSVQLPHQAAVQWPQELLPVAGKLLFEVCDPGSCLLNFSQLHLQLEEASLLRAQGLLGLIPRLQDKTRITPVPASQAEEVSLQETDQSLNLSFNQAVRQSGSRPITLFQPVAGRVRGAV